MEVSDVMNIQENEKYDLITVGQALHFFPIEQSLIKIRALLNADGNFTTFGYVIKEILSKNPQ